MCALLAVPLGLLTEWKVEPFVADDSLGYFVRHLHELQPVTFVMIGLGVVFAYWIGRGSTRRSANGRDSSED
ncbi:MAG: hypothetical protein LLG00_12440 [Planctomycetaceae bacterium]|nr:hypothetical protein [Planctomycetaceae bacterium]